MAERHNRHLEQAIENQALAHTLLSRHAEDPSFALLQWATTIAFYASVHYVEATLLAQHGVASASHRDRAANLARLAPADIYSAHQRLLDFSMEARYKLARYAAEWVDRTVFQKYLARIERWATP